MASLKSFEFLLLKWQVAFHGHGNEHLVAVPGGKIFSRTTPASTRNSLADGSRFSRLDEKLHCGLSRDGDGGDVMAGTRGWSFVKQATFWFTPDLSHYSSQKFPQCVSNWFRIKTNLVSLWSKKWYSIKKQISIRRNLELLWLHFSVSWTSQNKDNSCCTMAEHQGCVLENWLFSQSTHKY